MLAKETALGDGISFKECRSDLGLTVERFRAGFGYYSFLEPQEQSVKIPVEITGFNASASVWLALEMADDAGGFLCAAKGDLLAVRRARQPRNGQIIIIKNLDQLSIRRVFFCGEGVALRSFDGQPDLLVLPSAVDVSGIIAGIAIEGCWFHIICSSVLQW